LTPVSGDAGKRKDQGFFLDLHLAHAHPHWVFRSDIFRNVKSEEAFKPPQGMLLDLPPQFTLDELSTELLNALFRSSECMARIAVGNRITSTEEQEHILDECLIFHRWYLGKLIEERGMIQKCVHYRFRAFLRDLEAIRGQLDLYKSKSESRHQEYGAILHEANNAAKVAENITPALVENILSGDENCVWTPSIQAGVTDCIQAFARLMFQALSVPMKHGKQ
jgi:hypothetical protein